jgi:glycosyltransferase involved in cell wall biosynthesis
MRILYVVPFVPWPLRVRSVNLIPRLAKRHAIDLVCLARSANEVSKLDDIGSLCASVKCATHSRMQAVSQTAWALPTAVPLRMSFASSAAMVEAVQNAIAANPPDVIYAERWRALQYVPCDCGIPVVCDPTDSMILYNRRLLSSGSWWERIIGAEEYVKFLRYEPVLARRADVNIFCSTLDRDCLLQRDPSLNCEIVPNGVNCELFFPKNQNEVEPATVIFTGNFGYRPNFHAASYFIQEVLPTIRLGCPELRFLVVGNDATRRLKKYRAPGIELIDFVPDLRPYIAKAAVAVAPLTLGTGVSNKVLEAFAVGTPVVATALACGDLPVRDGEHLFLAKDSKPFADRVLELLRNSSLRATMAEKGRALVEAEYDWEAVTQKLENVMYRLVETRTPVVNEMVTSRPA